MDEYGSYSYVYVIERSSNFWGYNPTTEAVMVVDNPDEALKMINEMNNLVDSVNEPFWKYGFQAVPFKHRN